MGGRTLFAVVEGVDHVLEDVGERVLLGGEREQRSEQHVLVAGRLDEPG